MTFNMNDVLDVSVSNVTTTDVLAKPNGTYTTLWFRASSDNPAIARKPSL